MMNKLLAIGILGVFGAVSGVFVGTQYIEAQKPVTTFTGLVVASDAEPIVLRDEPVQSQCEREWHAPLVSCKQTLHIEPTQAVGTEHLQGGEDNTTVRLQTANVKIQ